MKTTFLTIVLALMCSGVRAQTAEFKCPTPGTTVEFTGSGQTVWLAQQGQMCKRQGRDSSGRAVANNWFAPTLSQPENQSQALFRAG